MHRIPIRGWAWVSRLGAYAIVCALPVIAVGLLLAADFRAGARERGREQAALVSTPPTIGRGTAELHRLDVVESHETSHLLGAQERDLVIGLSGLYVVLALIAAGVGVRLRRESTRNAFLADHDRITGLPNRRSFALATRSALQIARSTDSPAAIAIIDIDRFKAINDTLGYTNGDCCCASWPGVCPTSSSPGTWPPGSAATSSASCSPMVGGPRWCCAGCASGSDTSSPSRGSP
jgi:GGDEF domain-containing protein